MVDLLEPHEVLETNRNLLSLSCRDDSESPLERRVFQKYE